MKSLSRSFALLVTLSLGIAHADDCLRRTVEAVAFGQKYEITYIDALPTLSTKYFKMEQLFGSTNETLLGFMNNGHAFLQVGPARYDGEISAAGKVAVGRTTFQESTLIRFTDLPPETVEKLRQAIEAKQSQVPWSVNCVQGACNFLSEEGGIELQGWTHKIPLPTFFIRDMVKYGFVDADGKRLAVQFYATNGQDFDDLFQVLREREFQIGSKMVGSAAQSAIKPLSSNPRLLILGIGAAGIVLFFYSPDGE